MGKYSFDMCTLFKINKDMVACMLKVFTKAFPKWQFMVESVESPPAPCLIMRARGASEDMGRHGE